MRPTELSLGAGATAALLLLFAWLLGDPYIYALGVLVLLVLLIRFLVFYLARRRLLPSVAIARTTDGRITRVGRRVNVTTSVAIPAMTLGVRATDLPPPGTAIVGGSTSARLSEGSASISYTLQPTIRGKSFFEGLALALSDPFFTEEWTLREERYRLPRLAIYPQEVSLDTAGGLHGEQEREYGAGLPSHTVRSFREYHPGDDPRRIDWKVTAKQGQLFTRQYSREAGGPPVIVVDCPRPDAGIPAGTLARLDGAVAGAIEDAIGTYKSCSLFVIAGPNLVRALPFEENPTALLEAASITAGIRGITSSYRARSRQAYRLQGEKAQALSTTFPPDSPEAAFCKNLAAFSACVLATTKSDPFEVQMQRALAPFASAELHIFGTFQGDLSHIDRVLEAAQEGSLASILHVPKESTSPDMIRHLSRYLGVEVSVL